MNKWVKRGLLLGAGYIATKQAVKWIDKKDYVDQLMTGLKKFDEYKELRTLLMQVLDSFSEQKRVETEQSKEHFSQQQDTTSVKQEESIADAVKSVLDTPLVADLIPDQKDVDMIKDVIDEAAKVEKLVRDWLK